MEDTQDSSAMASTDCFSRETNTGDSGSACSVGLISDTNTQVLSTAIK